MCIYCNTTNYHKIYENHIGPIPYEENGRIYEIHHIDGNHSNNDPNNLVAVTLQEHYDIHYAQGDYGACYLMSVQRMDHTPQEISELASKHALQRIANGDHHFLNSEWHTKENLRRVDNGTHPWVGGEQTRKNNKKMLEEGTHPLSKRADGTSIASDRVGAGTHPLLKRADGSSVASDLIKAGTHPTQLLWICPHCHKTGKGSSNYLRWHGDNCKLNTIMNDNQYPEEDVYDTLKIHFFQFS